MTNTFVTDLQNLGYTTEILGKFVVFDYTILEGRFKNKIIKLGFELVQFPIQIPHGPHFSPLLVPVNPGAPHHPERIHASDLFKNDGGHLSRPYPSELKKTVGEYMSYIGYLFNTL